MKPTRKQVMARNKAKNEYLNMLRNTIEEMRGEAFTINLVGCRYNVLAGVFEQVDFYNKMSKLEPACFVAEEI